MLVGRIAAPYVGATSAAHDIGIPHGSRSVTIRRLLGVRSLNMACLA